MIAQPSQQWSQLCLLIVCSLYKKTPICKCLPQQVIQHLPKLLADLCYCTMQAIQHFPIHLVIQGPIQIVTQHVAAGLHHHRLIQVAMSIHMLLPQKEVQMPLLWAYHLLNKVHKEGYYPFFMTVLACYLAGLGQEATNLQQLLYFLASFDQ